MNLTALLAALAIIESSDARHPQGNDLARGRRGEVSRYQIMPATWRAYGGGALANARDPAKSKVVAMRIVQNIHSYWFCICEKEDVLTAAVVWNSGPIRNRPMLIRLKRMERQPNCYAQRVWREYQAIVRR